MIDLQQYLTRSTADQFLIDTDCSGTDIDTVLISDWWLCGTETSRLKLLQESTFALIPAPENTTYATSSLSLARLYEALRAGSIPVILGGDRMETPYTEVSSINF